MKRSPFDTASLHVREWLDSGPGAEWCKRARVPASVGHAWDVEFGDATLPVAGVRIVLPPDFPASPCKLYVDKSYFLKLPHVEADGHVCLGIESIPEDYEDPVSAVTRALTTLNTQLLGPARDSSWIEAQFHSERASYWAHYCGSRRKARDRRPVPKLTYVDIGAVGLWAEGFIAAYIPAKSKHRRYSLQVAAASPSDPQELAARHRWADGTFVRGEALFVRLPDNERWTPSTWPTSFEALKMLIDRATNHECSLEKWANRASRAHKTSAGKRAQCNPDSRLPPGQVPLLVLIEHDGVMFGYQIFGAAVWLLQPPSIEPVNITRVDADWALARDHSLGLLQARREKRVLLLGCGSLGSPLAKALARSGVGHLDIVDAQLMGAENTSRHALGMRDVGRSKADALAQQLRQDIPGLIVHGYLADASMWATTNCKPGMYDMVVECTAESSVRTFISHMRTSLFGEAPIVHAWTEPLCSAGHVVLTQPDVAWPAEDPADTLVNASDLSARDTRVKLPACSDGFHPYGAADIELVAAFAAERVIGILNDMQQTSTVWSWVRSSAYFEELPVPVNMRSIVPVSRSRSDSATTTRELRLILDGK